MAAPRTYSRHQRYRKLANIRLGARQFSAFLSAQATRLSISTATVFTDLQKNSAARISNAATTGDLA